MKESVKCSFLMGAFYSLNCLIFSYAVLFLGEVGLSDAEVGVLIAVAGIVGAVMQIVSGRLADRKPSLYWKRQLLFFGFGIFALSCLRLLEIKADWWNYLSYGLLIVFALIMMPLINTATFFYSSHGAKVNFGIARGIGSVAFAIVSYLTGLLAAKNGVQYLLWIMIFVSAAFAAAVVILPGKDRYPVLEEESRPDQEKEKGGLKQLFLITKYPSFFIMTGAIALVFIFHNILNTYLLRIIEPLGGSSEELGIALAIGAVVEIPILFIYSRLARIKGVSTRLLIVIGCGFFTLRAILCLVSGSVVMIYLIMVLQGVSYALLIAAKATYADESMEAGDKTTGQAAMSMTDSLGMVVGNLLGGVLLSKGGVNLMLICAAAIALAGFVIALLNVVIQKTKQKKA